MTAKNKANQKAQPSSEPVTYLPERAHTIANPTPARSPSVSAVEAATILNHLWYQEQEPEQEPLRTHVTASVDTFMNHAMPSPSDYPTNPTDRFYMTGMMPLEHTLVEQQYHTTKKMFDPVERRSTNAYVTTNFGGSTLGNANAVGTMNMVYIPRLLNESSEFSLFDTG